MGKIIALDFGLQRTGVAITDELQIIASPLETVESRILMDYLEKIIPEEKVELIIVGLPVGLNNEATHLTENVKLLIEALRKKFPTIKVESIDERFTSKMAQQTMITGGMKKKDRQVKGNLDKISAAIILQSYLSSK